MSQITGPVLELVAKVKKALDSDTTQSSPTYVGKEWGNYYVRSVELVYSDGDVTEVVGYLIPDEAEGNSFDFWTEFPAQLKRKDV